MSCFFRCESPKPPNKSQEQNKIIEIRRLPKSTFTATHVFTFVVCTACLMSFTVQYATQG